MIRIKDLPTLERPRERLINQGINTLSNEELIAIILKTGNKEESSKVLATNILKNLKNINDLNNITLTELLKIKGIGLAKATELLASIELGKRVNTNSLIIKRTKFTNPDIIFDYYKDKLSDYKQEVFYAVYLDASKKIIEEKELFKGTINQSLVHPRDIFKYACILDASSIICIHNHPSGNIIPSKEDIKITNGLKQIGILFNIPIIDHIIIGKDKYYSFYENGDI